MAKNETFSILTGGGADSLDGILTPSNGDFAYGNVSGLFHGYTFDTSETGSENSPYQIKADDATTGSWMLGGFKGAFSHVSAHTTAGQSIPDDTATLIVYGTEVYDILDEYVHTTGIFTAKYAGYYSIKAQVLFTSAAWAAGENTFLAIYKNNAIATSGIYNRVYANITTEIGVTISKTIFVDVDDFIDIRVRHNQGAAVTLETWSQWSTLTIDRIA